MKKTSLNIIVDIIIFFAVLILISACVKKETVIKTIKTELTPNSSMVTKTEVIQIKTEEFSATATYAVTITPMPSLIPTVTNLEMKRIIEENLTDNQGCDLPCLWGFTPGESSSQEVKTYLNHLGWEFSERFRESDVIFFTGKDIDENLSIRISYFIKENMLELIQYTFTHPKLDTRDQILSPFVVMDNYGIPDQVWVNINLSGEKSLDIIDYGGFEVYLYYQDPSFFIRYNGYAPHEKGSFKICLLSENERNNEIDSAIESVSIYSANENKIVSPIQIMEYVGAPFTGRMIVEEAFHMTPQEFYEFIVDQQNQPCFSTGDEIWQK